MKWLRAFWGWISGRTGAREMCEDFARTFPGKCMICSNRRYGISHGHIRAGTPPQRHHCIELEAEMNEPLRYLDAQA